MAAGDASAVDPDSGEPTRREDGGSQDAGVGEDAGPDGGVVAERYPATADNDLDGLSNELERRLHTDPEYADTDGDGVSDADEIGADTSKPRDSDGDGFADALEHARWDNDRDGTPDQSDPASAGAWQVVVMRTTAGVIANDGVDTTTLEAQLIGVDARKVTVGMDTNYWLPFFAPNELLIDGKLLGTDAFELFDDGTHGDRIAGDAVFTRDHITTKMHPRQSDPLAALTPRGQVMIGFLEQVSASGSTERKQLGYWTDGHPLVPGSFWLKFIEASTLRPVTKLGADSQQTDYVLNVADAKLAMAAVRSLAGKTEGDTSAVNELVTLLDRLAKTVDFLYLYPSHQSYGTLAGANNNLSNRDKGTGHAYDPPLPVDRGARSLILLDHTPESPIHHETMHQWGAYLDATLGFTEPTHHWGTVGTIGVLGGFDPASLIKHNDGTYTVDRFEPGGGTWSTTPYGDLELYLMGLLGPDKVAPIPMLLDPQITSGTDTTVTVTSGFRTTSIADIVAKHGARDPSVTTSPKHFESAFVIVSERLLTPAELAFVDSRARAIESTTPGEILSFPAATRQLGTMRTKLSAP